MGQRGQRLRGGGRAGLSPGGEAGAGLRRRRGGVRSERAAGGDPERRPRVGGGGFPPRFVLAELVSGAAPGVERAVSLRDRWRRSSPLNGIYGWGISGGPGERVEARPAAGPGRPGRPPAAPAAAGAGQGAAAAAATVHGAAHPLPPPAPPPPPQRGQEEPARPSRRLLFPLSPTPPSPHGVRGRLTPSPQFLNRSRGVLTRTRRARC